MTETLWTADGYEHWKSELAGGSIELSRCLHNGIVYGHSWECASGDKLDAARLFLAAKRQLRRWGGKKVLLQTNERTHDFWIALGAKFQYAVYEYELPGKPRSR